jgi:hypothetical protein
LPQNSSERIYGLYGPGAYLVLREVKRKYSKNDRLK